ncbi:MAG: ABC transporter substrate-binding protein [Geminicoccaceae bacterium]
MRIPLLERLLLVTAALLGASQAAAQAPAKLTPAVLQLSWSIQGRDAPFVLGIQRGYYRDAGIDLTINEGNGSLVSAQTAATGKSDFASADVTTGILLAAKGAKIKSIFVYQPKGGLAVAYHPGTSIAKMADLKGLRIIRAANDNASQVFTALLAKNNMSWDDLNVTIVGQGAFESSFLADPKSILLGNFYSTFQAMKLRNPSMQYVLYSDLGLTVMSLGVLASEKTLAERPDLVRRFLAATVRAFEASLRDPEAAIKAVQERFPLVAKPEVNRLELAASLSLLRTPENEGKVPGWTSPQQWEATVDVLRGYAGLSTSLPVSSFYTNDFLPQK